MLPTVWKFTTSVLVFMQLTVVSSKLGDNDGRIRSPFKTFPMLYFSKQDQLLLRSQSSDSHEKISREIRTIGQELKKRPSFFLPPKNHTVFASRWNEVYGNNLCGFAIYCFLYPQDESAFSLIKTFMDTMASYPDWYVASSYGIDEVPIGHSLYGFTTAFDMLYERFSSARIKKYTAAIKTHSLTLFSILSRNRHGWSRQYIHNHAATNIVALLMGGLVVSVTEPEVAAPWIIETRRHLDMGMEILKHVTDGTLDEGVSYGSYTSRGLTTYVFLAKRHFGVDHTSNPWLKQHFWFYYDTILPGFQRSVGIGDANHNWFYGPCSQLVFLDNFVLKNGYGNWLADKIRSSRPKNKPLAPSNSSVYSTLHTEYIFYNASIAPHRPNLCDNSKLHIFSDWGVATYGAGQRMKAGNTFLSVKSGIANGEGVENIRLNKFYPTMVSGWKAFNPGHEHPDQNSFTFSPNGRYFITEALYGPKLTILDNTYSFAPSTQPTCNQPWEGQVGECAKWLRYNDFLPGIRGEILTATTSDDMVFIASEAGKMYSKSLGIGSYFRGVLLLNPEVLIVVDSITLRPGSKTTTASATFHNMLHPFKPYRYQKYEGAQIVYPEGSYKVFSLSINDDQPKVTLHEGFRPQYLREGPTNYINVTFLLDRDVTTVAHVFSGPKNTINALSTIKSTPTAVVLKLEIEGVLHEVNISTFSRSWTKKKSAIKERTRFLGFPGYAKVCVGTKTHRFGYSDKLLTNPSSSVFSTQRINTELIDQGNFRYTMSDLQCLRTRRSVSNRLPTMQNKGLLQNRRPTLVMAITGLSFISVVVMAIILPQSKILVLRKIRSNASTLTRGAIALLLIISINVCCIDSDGTNICVGIAEPRLKKSATNDAELTTEGLSTYPSSPTIFSFSLPASGGDILENLFGSPSDFLVLSSSHKDLAIPVDGVDTMTADLCSWPVGNHEIGVMPSGWLTSLTLRPFLHLNQARSSTKSEQLRKQVREYPLSSVVLFDNMGFWMTKIPWIKSVLGDNLLSVLMVRDPRSWIHAISNDSDKQRRQKTISGLVDAYDRMESCEKLGLEPPASFGKYAQQYTSSVRLSEKLAVIWSVAISNALASTRKVSLPRPIHVVRFEDIITQTEDAASDLFSRLGFPLGIKHMSNVTRIVRSTFYRTPYDGIITPSTLNMWRVNLQPAVVKRITEICCPVMEVLGYSCDLR